MYTSGKYISQECIQIIGAEIKRRRIMMSKTLEKTEISKKIYGSKRNHRSGGKKEPQLH